MTNFNMEVKGFNRVANKLRKLAAELPDITEDEVYAWAQKTRGKLKAEPYPPKRPNQKYIRTGRLANSWRAARTNKGAIINNTASFKGREYSRYVVGDGAGERQAWMHKGRWWKARNVIDDEIPELRRALGNRLLREWRK